MASKRDITSVSSSEKEDPSSQPASKRQRGKASTGQAKQQSEPRTDLTYGQRCVFPGLDGTVTNSDDDLELEDEQDALAYLRSVRQEASGIPHLLVAPRAGPQLPPSTDLDYDDAGQGIDRSIYTDGKGDFRGYYHDGAYTAAPDIDDDEAEEEGSYQQTREDAAAADDHERISTAYYTTLISQFDSIRALLQQDPPAAALAALPHGQDADVRPFGPRSKTFTIWSARLRQTDPLPAQVASMDKAGVVRLLRVVLGGKFLRRGVELRERTSRWVWALLARLPERGELDHVEVGVVRELGKRAVLMLTTLAEMVALREEVELDDEEAEEEGGGEDWEVEAGVANENGEDGEGKDGGVTSPAPVDGQTKPKDGEDNDDEDMEDGEVSDEPTAVDIEADIAAAKARLLADVEGLNGSEVEEEAAVEQQSAAEDAYDESRARMNMRATLNMILTVAGEFYGQRDLLEFRDPFMGL